MPARPSRLLLFNAPGGGQASAIAYDATYPGDATGVTDVTTDFVSWVTNAAQSGTVGTPKRLALASNGTYRISRQSASGVACRIQGWHDATLDFRGSQFVMDPLPNLRSGSDASVTNGSKVVTSATANFNSGAGGDLDNPSGSGQQNVMVIAGVPYTIGTIQSTTQMTMPSVTLFGYLGTTGGSRAWYIRPRAPHGILRFEDCHNITLNDPRVTGTAHHIAGGETSDFFWVDSDQYEHAISLLSGQGAVNMAMAQQNSAFTINNLVARYCGGDAVASAGARYPTNVAITAISTGVNPTTITVASSTGFPTGTFEVSLSGTASTPNIDGRWTATAVDTTHFTIGVLVTAAGSLATARMAGPFWSPNYTINNMDVQYMARNAVAPIAGTCNIIGGSIAHLGLHGIDAEPNNGDDARSINFTVNGLAIATYGDLNVETGECAVVAGGNTGGTKIQMTVTNCTADCMQVYARNATDYTVTNNTSQLASRTLASGHGAQAIAYWETITNPRTFSGNSANMSLVNGHP